MKVQLRLAVALLIIIGTMIACSQETNQPAPNEGDSQTDDIEQAGEQQPDQKSGEETSVDQVIADLPEPPDTLDTVLDYPMGSFAGTRYDEMSGEEQNAVLEELTTLPKLESPTHDEIEAYWRTLLSLFHEDYPGPENVLEDMRIEAFGSPDIEDERYHFKEQLNVEIVLDASGSMAGVIGGKSKMEIAKEAIREFMAALPEEANVGLRVFGHKGSNAEKDKEVSCASSELVYDIQPYDSDALNEALDQFQPTGYTPIDLSLKEAEKDLADFNGDKNTNIIYFVGDGVNTCGGDPVGTAKAMAESDIQPIMNVIGFNVDAEGQQELKEIAEAADGTYSNANNQEQLQNELQKAEKIAQAWEQWKRGALNEAVGHKVEQSENIRQYNKIWRDNIEREDHSIMTVTSELRDRGHISDEAGKRLWDKREERYKFMVNLHEQLEDELYELRDKNFQELEEAIDNRYKQNTD